MLDLKKKKKKKVQGLSRNYSTFTFPDHCTSSCAHFSASKPYLVAMCDEAASGPVRP
jgi:hypothetical protein